MAHVLRHAVDRMAHVLGDVFDLVDDLGESVADVVEEAARRFRTKHGTRESLPFDKSLRKALAFRVALSGRRKRLAHQRARRQVPHSGPDHDARGGDDGARDPLLACGARKRVSSLLGGARDRVDHRQRDRWSVHATHWLSDGSRGEPEDASRGGPFHVDSRAEVPERRVHRDARVVATALRPKDAKRALRQGLIPLSEQIGVERPHAVIARMKSRCGVHAAIPGASAAERAAFVFGPAMPSTTRPPSC